MGEWPFRRVPYNENSGNLLRVANLGLSEAVCHLRIYVPFFGGEEMAHNIAVLLA